MADKQSNNNGGDDKVAVVKKYANRRLYNTASSSYVTLDDLSKMVRNGEYFVVYDAKSGEDLTRSILTQIILEEGTPCALTTKSYWSPVHPAALVVLLLCNLRNAALAWPSTIIKTTLRLTPHSASCPEGRT